MKFNLATIRPQGFLHSSAFAEVKDSLAWSLTALGHEVMLTENVFSAGASTNILFGTELFSPTSGIPDNAILFNMEQPSHPNMSNVQRLAKGRIVWDYSAANVAEWKALGIDARHLPIGYTPNLTRIPKPQFHEQDIDVSFFGWMTPRRIRLIADLRAAGLEVYASDLCYGGARDQIISRSKVCLNVHHDGRDRFEIVRISYLLANSKCVVTEIGVDDADYLKYLDGGLEWWPYEYLVKACVDLVHDDQRRGERELAGFSAIQKLDFTVSVVTALGTPSTTPIQTRYQAGCQTGDMKDFLATLRGLAKGKVLEIGVRDGASTSALLLGLEERGGRLQSVDITDCSSLWTHPLWDFCQADSKVIQFDNASFDMALIDGDHSPQGFLADLNNCLQWVKPGGLILCHDITPLPNCTQEAAGGDWPSEFVGKQFFSECTRLKLRHFVHPGAWGLGVIIKDPA